MNGLPEDKFNTIYAAYVKHANAELFSFDSIYKSLIKLDHGGQADSLQREISAKRHSDEMPALSIKLATFLLHGFHTNFKQSKTAFKTIRFFFKNRGSFAAKAYQISKIYHSN